jgi:hypothetical protein
MNCAINKGVPTNWIFAGKSLILTKGEKLRIKCYLTLNPFPKGKGLFDLIHSAHMFMIIFRMISQIIITVLKKVLFLQSLLNIAG